MALGSVGRTRTRVRPEICCGVVNRGLAIYKGMIFAPIIDGRLQALDAETGKVVWDARVAYPAGPLHDHDGAAHRQGQGHHRRQRRRPPDARVLRRLRREDGPPAWRFYTVPGDPAKGFENAAMKKAAATWDQEWWKNGGGGAVWDGMAYDPDAGAGVCRHGQRRAVDVPPALVEGHGQPVCLRRSSPST